MYRMYLAVGLSVTRPPTLGQSAGVEASLRRYNDIVSREINDWEHIEADCDEEAKKILGSFFRSMKRKARDKASDYSRKVYEHDRRVRQLKYDKLVRENKQEGLPPPPKIPAYMSSNEAQKIEGAYSRRRYDDTEPEAQNSNQLMRNIGLLQNELEKLASDKETSTIPDLREKYPDLIIGDASNITEVIQNTNTRLGELEKQIYTQNAILHDITIKEDRIMEYPW